ncbi:MAG: CRISPR-associated helicase Cas3' [Nitrososphaerota archaeon]
MSQQLLMHVKVEYMIDLISIYDEVKQRLNGEERPLIRDVLKSIEQVDKPFLYIVKAPTGYGKTAISISCAVYSIFNSSLFTKVVHILPMRSIVEDVYFRASRIMGKEAVKEKMMDVEEEKLEVFHLFPLNVTTVDTFTWDVMKLNTKKIGLIREEKAFGYDYLTQGSLMDSLLFFDEAHYILEDEHMKIVFAVILELLLRYKTSLIISTATLSKGYEEYFLSLAEGYGYDFKIFAPEDSDPFIKREEEKDFNIHLVDNDVELVDNIARLIDLDKVNLVVVNSPYTAVSVYDRLSSSYEVDLFLLHGNMKKKHRENVLEKIRMYSRAKTPSIIITTQVIEAGVDISSDVLITELSVAQSLIQRMGRVARYNEKFADIYILKSPGEPYPADKIEKTWRQLKEDAKLIHPRIPSTYYNLLNQIHGRIQQEVDIRLSPNYTKAMKQLLIKLLDIRVRAPEILGQVESIIRQQAFLREFTIPVKVEDEYILFSPREVEKMFRKNLIEVRAGHGPVDPSRDFYKLAEEFALGKKSAEVVYIGEYDWVRGILP